MHHYQEIETRVFLFPGGEDASHVAYEKLTHLIEAHDDMEFTVYRGQKSDDGTWLLVLMGEKATFSRYHEQIEHPLLEGHAQPLIVPPEQLRPLVKRFFVARAEMRLTKTPFVKKHHKKHRKKKW